MPMRTCAWTLTGVSEFDTNAYGANEDELELIKRKSSIWAYEREWRYIKSKDECDKDRFGYYKTINKLAVQDIIAGCKIDKNRLKEIIHIVHCNYTDKLKLKIAVPNGYNYRLDIVEYERISTFLPYESNM